MQIDLKDRNELIISIHTEKVSDKTSIAFMIKILKKVRAEGLFHTKAIYNKPTVNIVLNREKAFFSEIWKDIRVPSFFSYSIECSKS